MAIMSNGMQQAIQQQAPADWSHYAGDGTGHSGAMDNYGTTPEGWQNMLHFIQQFDPNASLQQGLTSTGEGGNWLQYDKTKLPQNAVGGQGFDYLARTNLANGESFRNPSQQWDDPVYGHVTHNRNLQGNNSTWLDTVGPMIPGLFAGGLGALGGFSGSSWLTNLLGGAFRTAGSGGDWRSFAVNNLLSNLARFGLRAGG